MLYTLGISIYEFGIRLASIWNPKAKAFINGRKDSFNNLPQGAIWMHCASLGEFEQGLSLLQQIKSQNPEQEIIVTFFSPSGYNHAQTKDVVDAVRYLPLDYPNKMKRWVKALNPQCLLLVKSELWPQLLKAMQKNNIPTHLVAGRFSTKQKHLIFIRKLLKGITHFWVQDEASAKQLKSLGIKQTTVVGDSRFDRVYANAQNKKKLPLIQAFKGKGKLLVMGSIWPAGIALLEKTSTYKLIVAPHDLKYVTQLKKQLQGLLYSQADESNIREPQILIIDNIGLLASIYKYADVAYIGGAFGSGLHNILEAAVYGCPLLFGPKHQNFPEAGELISIGGAKSISNKETFQKAVTDYLEEAPKDAILKYCENKRGASKKMWQGIFN
tara:strand:- start:275 stop:1426 length:1152 start_codon:yes stop_codon:yes gene_type:complete